jgi:hypothetical protein
MRNRIVGLVGLSLLSFCRGYGQQITRLDREERQVMLKTISDDIRRDYYDPKFHGVDWDAKLAEAKQKIEQAGPKLRQIFRSRGC